MNSRERVAVPRRWALLLSVAFGAVALTGLGEVAVAQATASSTAGAVSISFLGALPAVTQADVDFVKAQCDDAAVNSPTFADELAKGGAKHGNTIRITIHRGSAMILGGEATLQRHVSATLVLDLTDLEGLAVRIGVSTAGVVQELLAHEIAHTNDRFDPLPAEYQAGRKGTAVIIENTVLVELGRPFQRNEYRLPGSPSRFTYTVYGVTQTATADPAATTYPFACPKDPNMETAAGVPTLSGWGLLILGSTLAMVGITLARRRW